MDYYPIKLGIARPLPTKAGAAKKKKGGAGSSGSNLVSDGKLTLEGKKKIFERDDYTCACCGFRSEKYQEVLHKNSDETDFSEDNLITTCIFCYQCFNIEKVSSMRSGVLLWLPEIPQDALSHMARAIYVARISQGPMADAARRSLDALMKRREEVKERLKSDDPYILSMVLQDYLSTKHYAMRDQKLDGVRLFPLDRRIIKEADLEFNQFPQILAYWRSKNGPFGGKPPTQWLDLYKDLPKAA